MRKLLYIAGALMIAMNLAWAAIDINSATQAEFDSLPGIGPAKAKAIVDDRQKNGPFKSIEDFKRVKGIGSKTFEELKGQITVSGARAAAKRAPATTAAPAPATARQALAPAAAKPVPTPAAPAPAGRAMPIPAGASGAKPADANAAKSAPVAAKPSASLPAPAGARIVPAPAGAEPAASKKAGKPLDAKADKLESKP